MPSILRIFLTKKIALVYDITPYAFYDVVGVRRARSATVDQGSNGMSPCNTMPWGRWVSDYFLLSVFLRYEAYASRPTMMM
jgi:hypothetical protein